MDEHDETAIRLRAIRQLLSQSDIEQLYGADQATLREVKSLVDREIPPEVDEALTTFLAEWDIDLEGVDPLVAPALRIIFLAGRVEGWQLKQRVLATKVNEWIIRVPTEELEVKTPSPSIYHSSCPECGEKFDQKRYVCPECWAQVNSR